MAVKGKVASIEEIPEALREHYTQQGDSWVLDVSEHPHGEKVKEFRQKNVDLARRLEEMEANFAGVDIEEYRELKTLAVKQREKKLIDAGKVEEMFNERLAPIRAEKERIEAESKAERAKLSSKLETLMIDNQIREVAAKSGVRPTAIEDMILRGKQIFRVEGDNAVAKKGDEQLFGKNGEPLTMNEWVGGLAEVAPHLFESSQGGGAPKMGSGLPGASGRIARGDDAGFLANLNDIIAGKKKVG